jgi:hypothetical protein
MLWLKRKDPEGNGLDKLFTPGQMIPLHGIWFKIEKVEHSQLTLVPKQMTAARRKEVAHG